MSLHACVCTGLSITIVKSCNLVYSEFMQAMRLRASNFRVAVYIIDRAWSIRFYFRPSAYTRERAWNQRNKVKRRIARAALTHLPRYPRRDWRQDLLHSATKPAILSNILTLSIYPAVKDKKEIHVRLLGL